MNHRPFTSSTTSKQRLKSSNMMDCRVIGDEEKERNWIDSILHHEFFESCPEHQYLRKNEKNVFCIDCNHGICRHCATESHCLHRRLQICKYVYHDVVRLLDIQQHLDCSQIQTYKINGEKAVHLNSRPLPKDAKPSTKSKAGAACETCGRYIQDVPNRFCSIACKVSVVCGKVFSQKDHYESVGGKEACNNTEESLEEKRSCVSWTDVSEESEARLSSSFRPLNRLLKRKGIPQRSPLF